jgi:hypothetical protein
VCESEDATAIAFFDEPVDGEHWLFVGHCTDRKELYSLSFDQFLGNPYKTVESLAGLNEKDWVRWPDFMRMMGRLRYEIGIRTQGEPDQGS